MCGIFGYINHLKPRTRKEIIDMLIAGLKRLEYRGYDSAGMAIDTDDKFGATGSRTFQLIKKSGKVAGLEEAALNQELNYDQVLDQHSGIAHTRWATHGPPSEVNCHPHASDPTNEFVIIHNGIITNYKSIKTFLQEKGHEFVSETDTEVIVKLAKYIFDEHQQKQTPCDFRTLVEETILRLEGAFAVIFKSVHYPNEVVAARRGSPLLIGILTESKSADIIPISISDRTKKTGKVRTLSPLPPEPRPSFCTLLHIDTHDPVEYFLASDASALIEYTNRVIYLEDDDVVHIRGGNLSLHHVKQSQSDKAFVEHRTTLDMQVNEIQKGNFAHFMLKEIFEQPESVVNTMRGRVRASEKLVKLGGLVEHIGDIRRCRRLLFIACGTSYNSAMATRQFMEEMTELPVIVDIASDFLDRGCPIFRDDVCFFISQSGETADTLDALRYCQRKGALIVGITNTVGSTLSRESDCGVHINAGPEISVASTKAYTSQIITLVMFGLMMSEDSIRMQARRQEIIQCLEDLPDLIQAVLENNDVIKKHAEDIAAEKSILVMGRGYSFANCLEGALKIKELTYIHAEAILAGELKHGPLALIEEKKKIIMLIMKDKTLSQSENALAQITARHGRPLIICPEGYEPKLDSGVVLNCIKVPKIVDCLQSVLSVIPLQLLSYHIATHLGRNVDKPRNLAKSVTVA
ncbi:uncharacterized protein MONBRDRAFT_20634 [Monosiga brevicollis MX1]|uniref:glutamine--fructose-6-phosphate transaminase (isomerizing) n=1 Tax=Monosiga brevicollis TaxID=81824 RepID=A9UWQ6_MONBE|nr:uncharacterized protein MONBRDRAFT_20634 [Monosiga brevicollis MX1]EDQ90085.1 predicted protein [Monosiga brevicollis MX1]|eukprot:XP_001744852.1 hypothetical protein [Monosiga brevicollis MX1]